MTVERVRVGDLLRLERRVVDLDVDAEYAEIGVRSFGRGIFHKEPVSGLDLGTKRVFRIEPGDLVISNVFAWEGAIAVASDAEAGRIGSHRFMTYVAADDRIDPSWAAWYFLGEAGLELIRKASPGSAGRNRTLAVQRFEDLEIPVPTIAEQSQVAARLDSVRSAMERLSSRIDLAKGLASALAVSSAARPDLDDPAKARAGWHRVALHEVMAPASGRVSVEVDQTYPNLGIYSFGRGVFSKPEIDGAVTSATVLNRVRAGQFIYSRLFAFEGAYAYVPDDFEGFFVSNEFPCFDPDPGRLDAAWLATYLRSAERWTELAGASKGLGVRRQRIPVEAILAYEVWLPPIEVQRSMVGAIERLSQANRSRKTNTRRISALVPSALNEAFSGLS